MNRFTITDQLIRAYSRRGNYHSEASVSEELGLPGLVAQGMQALGPAYGEVLEAWGETFLARGELDVRFVGTVLAGHTIETMVDIDGDVARIEVTNVDSARTAVIGTARRLS
ncbi:MAG TPA: MaoC/PaaZ C-terminal domain-containing protein [Acidimicrobiia bacterium]|nr:MaoC/PaaZ C-terminal domain-containing protein [Acidimicrobiia bacterium]